MPAIGSRIQVSGGFDPTDNSAGDQDRPNTPKTQDGTQDPDVGWRKTRKRFAGCEAGERREKNQGLQAPQQADPRSGGQSWTGMSPIPLGATISAVALLFQCRQSGVPPCKVQLVVGLRRDIWIGRSSRKTSSLLLLLLSVENSSPHLTSAQPLTLIPISPYIIQKGSTRLHLAHQTEPHHTYPTQPFPAPVFDFTLSLAWAPVPPAAFFDRNPRAPPDRVRTVWSPAGHHHSRFARV
ncbi:hypothetical protein QC761_0109690 [Podospora bellae-mahoneyi]|uniref:Uncharacterized protein n=1 Tax=Podospora bellae-mahoneyi TaxID=2093777 RepID=A0ABR0F6E8_9PEZI|nr:hypothetical protein QC761_0109690 [Podospora bellae-mahoneyi]